RKALALALSRGRFDLCPGINGEIDVGDAAAPPLASRLLAAPTLQTVQSAAAHSGEAATPRCLAFRGHRYGRGPEIDSELYRSNTVDAPDRKRGGQLRDLSRPDVLADPVGALLSTTRYFGIGI